MFRVEIISPSLEALPEHWRLVGSLAGPLVLGEITALDGQRDQQVGPGVAYRLGAVIVML